MSWECPKIKGHRNVEIYQGEKEPTENESYVYVLDI